ASEVTFVTAGRHRQVLTFQRLKGAILMALIECYLVPLRAKQGPPAAFSSLAQFDQLLWRLMILDLVRTLGRGGKRRDADLLKDHDTYRSNTQNETHLNAFLLRTFVGNTADLFFETSAGRTGHGFCVLKNRFLHPTPEP